MNWFIKLFVTKAMVKSAINSAIRQGAKMAKKGNSERLESFATNGGEILAMASKVCEVVKDGEYTTEEEEILEPYVDASADAIMGFLK